MDIHRILTSALRIFPFRSKADKEKLQTDFKAASSLAMIDEIHFLNAISNLIDNAIKYSKGNPEINISTRNTKKGIMIIIEDKGIGISKENHEKDL